MLALLNDLTLVSDQTPSTFLFSNVFFSLLFSFNSLEVSVPNFQTHMINIPEVCISTSITSFLLTGLDSVFFSYKVSKGSEKRNYI